MRISILEDHASLGHVLQLSLRLEGHTVRTSKTADDFLELVTSLVPPDIIIVDFRLEGERSGADVIRDSRTLRPELPAILISAAPESMLQAATEGMRDVRILQKPFKMSALLEAIETIAPFHSS